MPLLGRRGVRCQGRDPWLPEALVEWHCHGEPFLARFSSGRTTLRCALLVLVFVPQASRGSPRAP